MLDWLSDAVEDPVTDTDVVALVVCEEVNVELAVVDPLVVAEDVWLDDTQRPHRTGQASVTRAPRRGSVQYSMVNGVFRQLGGAGRPLHFSVVAVEVPVVLGVEESVVDSV